LPAEFALLNGGLIMMAAYMAYIMSDGSWIMADMNQNMMIPSAEPMTIRTRQLIVLSMIGPNRAAAFNRGSQ
jgi:hypothetical protein